MNVYSDSSHTALKYLKDTEAYIHNLLIMTGDFNIQDSLWDLSFSYYSSISNDLLIIADSFDLELSFPTNLVLTRYSNNINDSNSVIDLMFFHSGSSKLNNHFIHPDWQLISDHASLTITIPIIEESINTTKHLIIKDSKKEVSFIKEVTISVRNLKTSNLLDIISLDRAVNEFTSTVNNTWEKNSKIINIMKQKLTLNIIHPS